MNDLRYALRMPEITRIQFHRHCHARTLFNIQSAAVAPQKLLLTRIFLQHTCFNNIWRHQVWIVN